MKNLNLFLLILSLRFSGLGYGQSFRGLILNKETRMPVPFCSVQVMATSRGTVSNVQGEFVLQTTANKTSIVIKSIGFKALETTLINDKDDGIYLLEPDVVHLNEVIIYSENKIKTLLKNAFEAIEVNYPQKESNTEGFYKESVVDSTGNLMYYGALYLDIISPEYSQKSNGKLLALKQRVFKDTLADSLIGTKFKSGPFNCFEEDYVRRKLSIINPKHFKEYDYTLNGISFIDARKVFDIGFSSNAKSKYNVKGNILIDSLTNAYIKIELDLIPKDYKTGKLQHNSQKRGCSYRLYKQKWYLDYYNFVGEGQNIETKMKFVIKANYITTNLEKRQATLQSHITHEQWMKESEIFSDMKSDFDENYWAGFSILPDEETEQKIKTLLKKQKDLPKK